MVLRILLSAAIVLNPVADVLANSQQAPRRTAVRGTHIFVTNAPDWIVEGAEERAKRNNARALELFAAAKTQIVSERLPQPYSNQIIDRIDDLIETVGGTAGGAASSRLDPINEGSGVPIGSLNPDPRQTPNRPSAIERAKNLVTGNSTDDARRDPLLEPVANANNTDSSSQNSTGNAGAGDTVPDTKIPVVDPKGTYLIAEHDPARITAVFRHSPETREVLWWITAGRLAAHSRTNRLKALIKRELGEDQLSNMDNFGSGFGMGFGNMEPGAIYDVLAWFGMFDKDYRKEMLKMKQKYDGARPQEISWLLIREATMAATGLGFVWGAAPKLIEYGPRTGGGDNFSTGGGFGAMGTTAVLKADKIITFILNTTYMARLGALHEVEMGQIELQLLATISLGFALFAMKFSPLGKNGIKFPSRPSPEFFEKLAKNFDSVAPSMAALARKLKKAKRENKSSQEVLEGTLQELVEKLGAMGVTMTGLPNIGNANVGGGNGGAGVGNDPLDPNSPNPNDPINSDDPAKKKTTKASKKSPGEWTAALLAAAGAGVINAATLGGITFGILYGSSLFFGDLYQQRQELANKVFLRGMHSHKKIPFLKLLIHTMYLGRNEEIPKFTVRRDDPQVAYILNLARSLGICSEQDFVIREAALKARKGREVEAAKAAVAEHLRKKGAQNHEVESADVSDIDVKKVIYACPQKPDVKNWNLLMREFRSFTAIQDTQVAHLRTTPLRDRVKMAQLYMQFLYVEDEPTQQEIEFYQSVVSRLIGFDSNEQNRYMSLFSGFLHKQGGMVENPVSPTGFSLAVIRNRKRSPYDYKNHPGSASAPFEVLAVDWEDTTDVSSLR